ncbi:polyhydroxyalkanoate synthase [Alteribacillus persepolensis]|uniref:Polyhydroxyalkanoate synthase n=1 Tax=Alteribacillus persepolensis TaxID=568899 RepID=A0A1G8DTG0_9BACI|nr:alpha/beta fold hydrolase [Alteribacillus persepolensis]SDH60888.1 polyhydroxyalkanoate synthase [Alteribacillus persepolensis]
MVLRKNENGRLHKVKEVLSQGSPQVGKSPKQAVWKKNKAALWYYQAKQKKYETPLFLVYSLVNRAFILDLAPGMSTVEAFTNAGFDVYLLDFGEPGYEDKDITVDDYVYDYIQTGVKKALHHSKAKDITIIGYCLGGTLAAMYAAVADEPIKNIVLMVAPMDFDYVPVFDQWVQALREGSVSYEEWIDMYGVIPAKLMEKGMRIASYPVYFSHYFSLLERVNDPSYVHKWRRFNYWTESHVPFAGAALKQLIQELVQENSLIRGSLRLRGKKAVLSNITANILVVSTTLDTLVPKAMSQSVVELVSSKDKTFKLAEGGHATLAARSRLPSFLADWLVERSAPV